MKEGQGENKSVLFRSRSQTRRSRFSEMISDSRTVWKGFLSAAMREGAEAAVG